MSLDSLQQCHEWVSSLPADTVDAHLPLKTLAHTIEVLQKKPSRGTRNDIQKHAKSWQVRQVTKKHKTNLADLKEEMTKSVIQESIRLQRLHSRVRHYSAVDAALHSNAC